MSFNIPKKYLCHFPFVILFVVLTLILPRSAKFGYDYKKGSSWKYETLVSQFDFPIYKTKDQIQQEKLNSSDVIPYFKFSEEITNKNITSFENLNIADASLKSYLVAEARAMFNAGITSDDAVKYDRKSGTLSDDILIVQKDKRANRLPFSEVYRQDEAKTILNDRVSVKFPSINVDSLFRVCGVADILTPNLVFDRQTTELVSTESDSYVSPTLGFVSTGQLIVSEGEIITAEIEQMLDSYKIEYEANVGYSGSKVSLWFGNMLIALFLVIVLWLAIFYSSAKILFCQPNELMYLLFIFLLATIGALTVGKNDYQYLYLVPFTLAALYLQAFFKNKVIISVYFVSLLPLLIYCQNGAFLYFLFSTSGLVSIYFFKYFGKGWKQFICALISFLVMLLVYVGFRAVNIVNDEPGRAVLFLFVGSFISVAGYSAIFLFEKLFNLVSNTRLVEMCDTENPLIRDLQVKAPGTFHHSVQVMNMCEAAARSIGANVPLIRAGALYHDIGKVLNPLCFVENERVAEIQPEDKGYHSDLTPQQSASDIIKHVQYGLELAEKHRLPAPIKDFIASHHGTTMATFFYNKYVNEGGDPARKDLFTYPGKIPVSKEQLILMICDSVEAASRSLKENTPKAYSDLVEKIVESKMNEGQFEISEISISELGVVKETIKKYLSQLHHQRIEYPKMKKIKQII